ncbi:uncharacterized protein MONOS_1928 [Monocercomonoides exilis]|uniref:uncharacterized protein n=1 Tax=Monocercomonoides exilis TaxID=2049356 RepID=UPI0035594757|nr:hypothetical protein MONOS_1928 [Monocercomonoides exilis]|eukprot:MONOS_1928.1-p1 / transcript=MONOS_1928.1 / gene=MONOS_1928 / organism=Monocercomonoides_exilis_PA203 / gene_product=unspecified product / transcript_product=unspecified product / location=Mono_scaffold00037:24391-25215(+) / protein_length=275 / sequence_SO=supercontig / SO=protein_coding / is_pseudo=false
MVCYWNGAYQHTEKKDWLKEGMKDRYVGVSGNDTNNLCGMTELAPCKTVGHAVSSSMVQLSSTITLLGGRHVSEGVTISVGKKKIIITGKGKTMSVIGTNSLSLTSTTLFSVSSGQLEVGHVGIDHNSIRSSLQKMFAVSLWKQQETCSNRAQLFCSSPINHFTHLCSILSSSATAQPRSDFVDRTRQTLLSAAKDGKSCFTQSPQIFLLSSKSHCSSPTSSPSPSHSHSPSSSPSSTTSSSFSPSFSSSASSSSYSSSSAICRFPPTAPSSTS